MTPDLERVARALFDQEWAGQNPGASQWAQDRPYWIGSARAAVTALIDVSDKAIFMSLPKFDTRGGASVGRRHFQAMLRAVLGDEQEGAER